MSATDRHPRVGDVYEAKYGKAKGKRVRLTRFHDASVYLMRWFETQTMEHPTSPHMVGSTGSSALSTLRDRWRRVESEHGDA